MDADERLARQLQQEEMQQANLGNRVGAPVIVGSATGAPMATGPMGPGVVYGTVVQGQPVVGQTLPGMATPAAYPIGAGMQVMPPGVASFEASPEELLVLRYRCSVLCFAGIDACSTLLHALSTVAADGDEEGDESSSMFGMKGDFGVGTKVLAIVQLVFLIGPVCGYFGAKGLRRGMVGVYLAFCIAKMSFSIWLSAVSLNWWYIIIALIEIYITKIVYSFWRALGVISPDRLAAILHPEFVVGRPVGMSYW